MVTTTLVGNEFLQVQGISSNGQRSAQTFETTTGSIAALASESLQGNTAVSTVSTSTTTNTTLLNATGLSVNVQASQKYAVYAYLPLSANATSGVKVALGGTAGLSAVNYTAQNYNTTTLNANANTTTVGTGGALGATAASTLILLEGSVSVATAGTLTIQFAQNVSGTGATSLTAGGYLALV